MPANISALARIAPDEANGEPLTITGRALGPNDTPLSEVIVYAFQTDHTGIYPMPAIPRSTHSQSHGDFRGWALTDAEGRYTFDTVRPGGYPDQGEPQHIHMVVIETGCGMYFVEDIHFADDPRLGNLSEEQRPNYFTGVFGSGVITPVMDEAGTWQATRDLYIGQGRDGYVECNRQ
jgi:protocatechuate 3,4-dioxygenase beta subunit